METTIYYNRAYIGILEKKIETTIMGYIGIIGYILGIYRDNGKENGNYYNGVIEGLGFSICALDDLYS